MRLQSHPPSAKPGPRYSNLTGRLPDRACEMLSQVILFFGFELRLFLPRRKSEATKCSFSRAQLCLYVTALCPRAAYEAESVMPTCTQRCLWAATRCPQAAYEAESVMPLFRHFYTVGARGLRSALIGRSWPRQNVTNRDFMIFMVKLKQMAS